MSEREITASTEDGREYPDWDTLVNNEANGYVVVAIIKGGNYKNPWPHVTGPYPSKVEAAKAKNRIKTKMKREQREHPRYAEYTFRLHIQPVWKDPRDRA